MCNAAQKRCLRIAVQTGTITNSSFIDLNMNFMIGVSSCLKCWIAKILGSMVRTCIE